MNATTKTPAEVRPDRYYVALSEFPAGKNHRSSALKVRKNHNWGYCEMSARLCVTPMTVIKDRPEERLTYIDVFTKEELDAYIAECKEIGIRETYYMSEE